MPIFLDKMKKRYFLLAGILGYLVSCSPALNLTEVQPQKNISVGQDIEAKKELVDLITPYRVKLDKSMNEKLSYTAVELNRNGDNSNLGEVLTDFTFDVAKAWGQQNNIPNIDATILNIGGIRTNIAKGDILLRHLFEVMPFENEIVIVKMRGEDIQGIFDYYEKTQRNNPVSGLYIETQNKKLVKGLIAGETPKAGKDYYIATSDYLALGGDSMFFFSKGEMIPTGIKLRDAFIETFKNTPEIKVKGEQRLKLN